MLARLAFVALLCTAACSTDSPPVSTTTDTTVSSVVSNPAVYPWWAFWRGSSTAHATIVRAPIEEEHAPMVEEHMTTHAYTPHVYVPHILPHVVVP